MTRRLPLLLVLVALVVPLALTGAVPYASADDPTTAEYAPGSADVYNFIIQLDAPSLVAYSGGIGDLAPTSPAVTGVRKLDANSPAAQRYSAFLAEQRAELVTRVAERLNRTPEVVRTYEAALNGLVLTLTAEEAQVVARLPGVRRITQERFFAPDTDRGPRWIGAPGMWGAEDGCAPGGYCGEGTIVGIIDSGINSDHPSFAGTGEDGYSHVNPFGNGVYKGLCATGAMTCNNKLIGVYNFTTDTGGEDKDGHGSHTASTSAGNRLYNEVLTSPTTSFTFSQISGVAPHANIIAYRVCVDNSCSTTASLDAIDQAILDGVDVLNYSISGSDLSPWDDPVEQAFLDARANNIFVAASAGNAGPGPGTVAHGSPWLTTVAASTHDRAFFNGAINLTSSGGSLPDIQGRSLTAGYGPADIVYAGNYGNPLCDNVAGAQFPAGIFSGQIVICDRGSNARVDKAVNVQAAGGGGMILVNAEVNGDEEIADAYVIPGVHITYDEGQAIKAWLATGTNHRGAIQGTYRDIQDNNGDVMASFSSRGPNLSAGDILKPDVTAPGADILAAVATIAGSGKPAPEFDLYSGTSMSSPHTAGAGALMIDAHPDWTIAEIQSALMMTSFAADSVRKEDGVMPTNPFDRGAGRLNLANAVRAGLVMNITQAQYTAADPTAATPGDPRTLNLPSMADDACATCSWQRTVRNPTNQTMTWSAKWLSTDGLAGSVSPSGFTLAPGQTATFAVTVEGGAMPAGRWYFGRVVWHEASNLAPDATVPVAVQPAAATNALLLSKRASAAGVAPGGETTYTLDLYNTTTGTPAFSVSDPVPANSNYVANSATGGLTYSAGTNTLTASGAMPAGTLGIVPMGLSGYQSLAAMGDTPSDLPPDTDKGCLNILGVDFNYNGTNYKRISFSVNGTLMPYNTGAGACAPDVNTSLPDSASPNNLIAPFWANLDMTSGGAWYYMTVAYGGKNYTVFEWENVPLKGTAQTATFQAWMENGGSNIWFAYPSGGLPSGTPTATIGLENSTGTAGARYYYNGTGTLPNGSTDLYAGTITKKTFTFKVNASNAPDAAGKNILNEVTATVGSTTAKAWANTHICGPAMATPLKIKVQALDYALLDWSATGSPFNNYRLLRGTSPYFATGAGTQIYTGHDLTYADAAAPVIGDPAVNHYYVLETTNCLGTSTALSAYAGEFDFALTPGQ